MGKFQNYIKLKLGHCREVPRHVRALIKTGDSNDNESQ